MTGQKKASTQSWKVSVVVVNYNGESHLDECLSSVQEAEGPIEEIIVVDDASTDGGVALVERNHPSVKIVRLRKNSGPAAARNEGIKAARSSWVCLIDNDVRVDRHWLVELMKGARQAPEAGLFSSVVAVYEAPTTICTRGLDVHFLGMPTFREPGTKIPAYPNQGIEQIGAAGGASLLIEKEKTGIEPFDPGFFYGFEDTDACLRLRIAGDKCYVVPGSIVFHKFSTGGVEGLSDDELRYPPARAFFVFRNRWWLILTYYELKTLLALGPALFLFEIVCATFALKRGVGRSYAAALGSLFVSLPSLLHKRKIVQKGRETGDRELLSACSLSPGSGSLRTSLEAKAFGILDAFFKKYWNFYIRFFG